MAKATVQAAKIPFEDFTVAVSSALLRAIETRKLPRGPILVGIILWPADIRPGAGSFQAGIGIRR